MGWVPCNKLNCFSPVIFLSMPVVNLNSLGHFWFTICYVIVLVVRNRHLQNGHCRLDIIIYFLLWLFTNLASWDWILTLLAALPDTSTQRIPVVLLKENFNYYHIQVSKLCYMKYNTKQQKGKSRQ